MYCAYCNPHRPFSHIENYDFTWPGSFIGEELEQDKYKDLSSENGAAEKKSDKNEYFIKWTSKRRSVKRISIGFCRNAPLQSNMKPLSKAPLDRGLLVSNGVIFSLESGT